MLHKEYYLHIKYMWEKENDRGKVLFEKGKLYISFATALSLVTTLAALNNDIDHIMIHASIAMFVCSFIASAFALSIMNYENISVLDNYINEIENEAFMGVENFYLRRIADFKVSLERNRSVNSKRAQIMVV